MDKKAEAAVEILLAIAQAVKELGTIPSGHLYARLMGHMSLDEYQKAIGILKRTGILTEENFLLRYAVKP